MPQFRSESVQTLFFDEAAGRARKIGCLGMRLGMEPLSSPSQFILWQERAVKDNFKEKELSHKHSTLVLVRLFVAAASTIFTKHLIIWRTEGQELLHLCVTKNISRLNSLQRMI